MKIIKLDILPYLNAISLTYWICDDGSPANNGNGLFLYTSGFTLNDVYLVAAIIHYVFGLVVNVQNHKG